MSVMWAQTCLITTNLPDNLGWAQLPIFPKPALLTSLRDGGTSSWPASPAGWIIPLPANSVGFALAERFPRRGAVCKWFAWIRLETGATWRAGTQRWGKNLLWLSKLLMVWRMRIYYQCTPENQKTLILISPLLVAATSLLCQGHRALYGCSWVNVKKNSSTWKHHTLLIL